MSLAYEARCFAHERACLGLAASRLKAGVLRM